MPSGLKRFQKAESLHFITFSCFHRLPLLESPETKNTVEAVLEVTRARHQARIYAYVLMPEHIHLLINEPPGAPSLNRHFDSRVGDREPTHLVWNVAYDAEGHTVQAMTEGSATVATYVYNALNQRTRSSKAMVDGFGQAG
jgi:REP element-mobilizing transposase RayT